MGVDGGGGDGDGGDGGGCGDGGDSGGDGGAGAAQLGYSVAKRSFCAEKDSYVSCRRLASASCARAVEENIPSNDVTEPTSHSSGWLKERAKRKVRYMLVTELVSHASGWLKASAAANIFHMFVTELVSQASALLNFLAP